MTLKRASKAQIDKFITGQIRKSDKAPRSWTAKQEAMRKAGTDIALDLKKQGVKLPLGLFLIIGAGVVAIILFIFWKSKGGEVEGGITPGELNEPIDLKGKDEGTLLDEFGFKKGKGKGGGRPFDES